MSAMTDFPPAPSNTNSDSNPADGVSLANPVPPPSTTVDTGHTDFVNDAKVDYYGTRLATTSTDTTIKLFSLPANSTNPPQLITTLTGHTGPVWSLDWSHPMFGGGLLASAGFDGGVIVWREGQGGWERAYTSLLHSSSTNALAFGPHQHGLNILSGSSDGFCGLIEYGEGGWKEEKVKVNDLGVNGVDWSPYKSTDAKSQRFVCGGCDNLVRFFRKDQTTGWVEEGKGTGAGHSDWVRDVAWRPHTGTGEVVASCSEDKQVIIWTQASPSSGWTGVVMNVFSGPVWRVSWSQTGNCLSVSYGEDGCEVWREHGSGGWGKVGVVE